LLFSEPVAERVRGTLRIREAGDVMLEGVGSATKVFSLEP
jgi:hypothetical protein